MRLFLIIVVIAAIGTLLWGAWHMGRRVFYPALVAVLAGLLLWVAATLLTDSERFRAAPTGSVSVTVQSVHETGTGYRFDARIGNQGEQDLARVWLEVEALGCSTQDVCKVLYRQQREVPIHVPAGGHYPLALVIDKPAQPISADRWRVQVRRVQVYGY